MRGKKPGVVACLTCLTMLAMTHAAFAAEDATLREARRRLVADWTLAWLPKDSPLVAESVQQLDRYVERTLSASGGYWSGWTKVGHPAISFGGTAFIAPQKLATAYCTPASRYYHDPAVLKAVEAGLKHLTQFVYPGCPQPSNWWAWQIGIPIHLIPTLMLLDGAMDRRLWDDEIATLRYLLKLEAVTSAPASAPAGSRAMYERAVAARAKQGTTRQLAVQPASTDMNCLWHYNLRVHFGLLVQDADLVRDWSELARGEMQPAGTGHLQSDYSYKFHGNIPMWAYGREFINDYGLLVADFGGTSLGPSRGQLDAYAVMLRHYVDGFLYHNRIGPAMIGRELTRGDRETENPFIVASLAAMAKQPGQQEVFAPLLARELQFVSQKAGTAALLAARSTAAPAAQPAPPVDDIFAYPDGDLLQVTRPNWAVGIKMHSTRNRGYESINGENLQGWFLSHGSTFHYLRGDEWDGCWPTLDWTRLPGTTVAKDVRAQTQSAYAGVLRSSRALAIAAMELQCGQPVRRSAKTGTKGTPAKVEELKFRAHKSWVVDEDAIICMGSGISASGRVETTVVNQPVKPGATLLVDGAPLPPEPLDREMVVQSLWLENMAYFFPNGRRVKIIRQEAVADWSSIVDERMRPETEPQHQNYITVVIPHAAEKAGYCYIMLPNVSRDALQARIAAVASRYNVDYANSHHLETRDGRIEAVALWQAGECGPVAADRGCIALRAGGTWQFVDPTWSDRPIEITIAGQKGKIQPRSGRPARLEF